MKLRRVINATGVILHTGAGRAPFGAVVLARAGEPLAGYSNLEVDLAAGERGRRNDRIAGLLTELAGAEDAAVVNNNAAAVMLALRALGCGRPAAAGRGQLVEIGGSFRLPAVMAAGGVELMPVGAVNATRPEDYGRALAAGADLVVLAHRSNFYFEGSYEEPTVEAVVALARKYGKPVLYDLGSGLLSADLYPDIIPPAEPNVKGLLAAGVDVVCFSGDKLLGGPQAGIAVGRAEAVSRLKADSLYRALRAGKETFALLTAVLELYLEGGDALAKIPVYRLLKRTPASLRAMAEDIAAHLLSLGVPGLGAEIVDDVSFVGGGTLPYLELATAAVALRLEGRSPHAVSAALRRLEPPVLTRASGDAVIIDCRSLLEDDVAALKQASGGLAKVFN